jgi:outer membrane protein insertion porin family
MKKMPSRKNINFCSITGLLLVFAALQSCNIARLSTKHIPEGDYLYTGSIVSVNNDAPRVDKDEIIAAASEVITPKPNDKTFWIFPFKLWIHNLPPKPPMYDRADLDWTDTAKIKREEKKNWEKIRRIGQPPVKRSQVFPMQIIPLMENRMRNLGYFRAKITFENVESKRNPKKVKIQYNVQTDSAYIIEKLILPDTVDQLTRDFRLLQKGALVRVGQNYNLQNFIAERERMAAGLKDKGYYFFTPDMLVYKVDSSGGNNLIVHLTVKPTVPQSYVKQYQINDIVIFQDFSLELNKMTSEKVDTLVVNGYKYFRNQKFISPELVTKYLFFRKGDIYSPQSISQSMKYITQLGVFKYMKMDFSKKDTLGANLLDLRILLSPAKRKALNLEFNYITKSTNFAGPGMALSFNHRNLFGGAEKFSFKIDAGWEALMSGQSTGYLGENSFELGVNTDLTLPRFFPFKAEKQARRFIPKTKFNLDYRYWYQVKYYRMANTTFSYGYIWQETEQKTHQFNLFSVGYQHLVDSTSAFHNRLKNESLLQRGYEDQFILGSTYSFFYSDLLGNFKNSGTYFNGNLELSGNTLYGIQKASKVSETPYKLFNTKYAQFVKVGADYRKYALFSAQSVLVTRLFAGIGLPVGNSTILPYMKQYFSGGSNGIRAFPARSIGPGRYVAKDDNLLIDKTGDIKLEANIEYRYRFWSTAEIALFADAGNVWLYNEDSSRPGAKFQVDGFYKDLAVGAGAGLRFDTDFFIVRLDVGFPIRRPMLTENSSDAELTWVFDKSASWGKLWKPTVNIAIGYPF